MATNNTSSILRQHPNNPKPILKSYSDNTFTYRTDRSARYIPLLNPLHDYLYPPSK